MNSHHCINATQGTLTDAEGIKMRSEQAGTSHKPFY
jgi:hypothetical protein